MSDATQPFGMVDGRIVPLASPDRRRSGGRYGMFDMIAPLARGGMGGVYLAAHHATGERVALKILDPQFANHPEIVARLYAEHTVAARVRHPGVVHIRATGRSVDGIPYLVMEYLDGETLGAIAERGTIEIPAIIAICAQVAAAVAALHDAGIIHCDVKPDNVFVLDDHGAGCPPIKVLDFGVSRFVDEPPVEDSSVAGTPWCMAPEQWQGSPGPRSDVYSLGCMLYQLTTGVPPFDGSFPELMCAHLEVRPSRPSWLRPMPIELERLILRSLAKDPAARPSMHELAGELAALADAQVDDLRATG